MAPVRVGFIGLSKTGWASQAHIPYLSTSSKYKIVAICNSSVESAQEAIELYKLPAETKAYGNPEGLEAFLPSALLIEAIPPGTCRTNLSRAGLDLAQDPNVDLVVCSVRVDRHFAAISPALKAGKNAFVEWPLGKNLEEAEELLRLSRAHGVKQTAVGLQARFAPSVIKIQELVSQGRIGKVLSSTWVGYAGNMGPTDSESVKYMTDENVGGNLVTIHFGHSSDFIQQVLGNFKSLNGILANRRPLIQLLNSEGAISVKDHPKTTNDTILVHGITKSDVPVSISLRGGKAFKGTPGQDWRIYGEKGEIRLTAGGVFLQIGYPDIAIAVHDFATNEVEEIDIAKDSFDHLDLPARNVAKLYEAVAEGDRSVLCDFEHAVERHRQIDTLYRANSSKLKSASDYH